VDDSQRAPHRPVHAGVGARRDSVVVRQPAGRARSFTQWFDNPRRCLRRAGVPIGAARWRPLVASSLEPVGGNCDGVVPQTVASRTGPIAIRSGQPAASPWQQGGVHFEIPPQPNDTAIYYYYDATGPAPSGRVAQQSPVAGPFDPNVFFVSSNDFGDQDRHDDFVDVFDVVRLVRHEAWQEAVAPTADVDFDHDGSLTFHDLDIAIGILESDKNNPIAVPSPGTATRVTPPRRGDARVSRMDRR
jgi:hypothetical protein